MPPFVSALMSSVPGYNIARAEDHACGSAAARVEKLDRAAQPAVGAAVGDQRRLFRIAAAEELRQAAFGAGDLAAAIGDRRGSRQRRRGENGFASLQAAGHAGGIGDLSRVGRGRTDQTWSAPRRYIRPPADC